MQRDVLLLASKGEEARRIARFCSMAFGDVTVFHGDWGDPFPEVSFGDWDYVFSYCSRWIVPKHVLSRIKIAAINFHPGSPQYPGIGCLNWALYDNAKTFGVTAHHITPRVDAGKIIEARLFDILPGDNVQSLFDRTHTHLTALAMDIIGGIAAGRALPTSDHLWSGDKKSRAELDALLEVSPEMDAEEIARRIRAVAFGKWQPRVTIHGNVFQREAAV